MASADANAGAEDGLAEIAVQGGGGLALDRAGWPIAFEEGGSNMNWSQKLDRKI
ncbi:hypothetical protein [Sinomonas terrae]|uniref:Uncharacterized protein n=1 Tax=Sinomonas terrae TaxID=2908838 RepID=A0ABS9U152_9MICC|nr:hypothetical protein [Sinomonas terrae]MCH6470050.1 hypothetical protein [Sinomonas terrae]